MLVKLLATIAAGVTLAFPGVTHERKHSPYHHRRPRVQFTGYKWAGRVSEFGWPMVPAAMTADGGSDARACIAVRDDWSLDRWYQVSVYAGRRWHTARLLHCDWGPAEWTGRAIDITGAGVIELGFNTAAFPTGAYGVARLIR